MKAIQWAMVLGVSTAGGLCSPKMRPQEPATASPAASAKGAEVVAVAPPAVDADEHPPGEHPRLLLTRERLERLRKHAISGSPTYRRIVSLCAEGRREPQTSGYEAWDWGNLMAECALAWHASHEAAHAETALRYLRALLDDKQKVGDGAGGDAVVSHDHGYPIRTFAFYAALAFDWLHDAPGMTPELREHTVARIDAWLAWYARQGYRRDDPIANYFTGYFGALSFGALATWGENPEGDALLRRAETLFSTRIVPEYGKWLAGGDWPEGWQYGDGAAVVLSLFVDGERTARGKDRLRELPWLREVVRHHTHAILPDGTTAYDNGDWSRRPARMPSRALDVLSMVLPAGDADGARARFLARQLRTPKDEWAWIELLTDQPDAPVEDPRKGTASLLAKGTGLVLARSGWSKDAVFVSLQSGPTIDDGDHQHADQGHFEVVRGADELLVDAADYGSLATINHNTILVDDQHHALDYAPNQGGFGKDSSIVRYVDRGELVFAEGDFTDAYRPHQLEWGAKRSVLRAQRALVYLRPGTLVIYDRVTVADPSYSATWAAHALVKPQTAPGRVSILSGGSRADVLTLLPERGEAEILAEPTNKVERPYETNDTRAPSFRIQIRGRANEPDRRFLHVIQAGAASASPPEVEHVAGDVVEGARIGSGVDATVVVFPRSGPDLGPGVAHWNAPRGARLVVVGLSPGARYVVEGAAIESGCRVSLGPGAGQAADDGGTLLVRMDACASH